MTKDEHIIYWKETAEKDYQTMKHLFQTGDYNWALFIGHLVIEKLLKALYVKLKDSDIQEYMIFQEFVNYADWK